jgi:hypothetical protein
MKGGVSRAGSDGLAPDETEALRTRRLLLVQAGRAGLDRRRARSRLNAAAAGVRLTLPHRAFHRAGLTQSAPFNRPGQTSPARCFPRLNRRWQAAIESCALPSFVVSTEVLSGLPDERLSIRHDAGAVRGGHAAGGPRGEVPCGPHARTRPAAAPNLTGQTRSSKRGLTLFRLAATSPPERGQAPPGRRGSPRG